MEIRIRPFRTEDGERLYAIESQPEMVTYQDFEARTRESAQDYVDRAIQALSDSPRQWHEYAIADESDTLIGRTGAWVEDGIAWLWYAVDPAAQGQGVAKRAVQALISLMPPATLKIECDPRNTPSCRLAEALGFVLESEGEIEVRGQQVPSRTYIRK